MFNAMFQLTDVGFHQEETNHLPPVWMREKKTTGSFFRKEVGSSTKVENMLKISPTIDPETMKNTDFRPSIYES